MASAAGRGLRRLAGLIALGGAWGLAAVPAISLPGDAAAIAKASKLDKDPADFEAVTVVCTRCHASSQFLSTPRSSARWEETYGQMSRLGATGSDEQLNRVVAYFQKNLTIINVNTSPAEELGPTLQVSDDAVEAILARRVKRPFASIADLATVPGVDRGVLETLKSNGCLQF
jgi:DNA uptake protein ComE-like DNA-binding protein